MPITNYYVDPSLGVDTGNGSLATPWGRASGSVVQYALNNITQGTGGDQINIKAGPDDVLSSALSLTTYGAPSSSRPLTFRGYTSAANDGGQGGISGNGSVSILASTTLDNIAFIDLHLHNCGSAVVIQGDDYISVVNCEINNTSGGGILVDAHAFIARCNIYDVGGIGIRMTSLGSIALGNYLSNSTRDFTTAIELAGAATSAHRNIINIDGTTIGISTSTGQTTITGNSILCAGGSGTGIHFTADTRALGLKCVNNCIEGFTSGTGIGLSVAVLSVPQCVSNNALFNNATNISAPTAYQFANDNEILSATPFAKSGSNTFANRFTYFAAANTGNVRGGAFQ